MSTNLMIATACVAAVVLATAVALTRAAPRRTLAVLVGGFVGIVFGMIGDLVCHSLGLWHYVGATPSHAPPLAYLAGAFVTAAFALVGWRVTRRFGRWGCGVFIVVMGVVMAVGDDTVGPQVLSVGLVPEVVDAIVWMGVVAVGQGTMRAVAGPATDDPLVRD